MFKRRDTRTKVRTTGNRRSGGAKGRPRLETIGYRETPWISADRVAPVTRARTYTIGELVAAAYARAARVTEDPEIEAMLATRLLAVWLARATASQPASETTGSSPRARRVHSPRRRPLPIERARRAAA